MAIIGLMACSNKQIILSTDFYQNRTIEISHSLNEGDILRFQIEANIDWNDSLTYQLRRELSKTDKVLFLDTVELGSIVFGSSKEYLFDDHYKTEYSAILHNDIKIPKSGLYKLKLSLLAPPNITIQKTKMVVSVE